MGKRGKYFLLPLVSDPVRSLTRRAKGRWPACAKPRLQKPCGGQALRRRQGRDFKRFVSNR
ncbi:MAG: hypothetical protein A2V86_05035 [Deltaproteobacteria bacterium RBG_16_49_23]|nr:MAG: hypothetical protein A2V86_05035 [Deltaproteobacteria bacterium RBG_16_49_23]